MSSQSKQNFFKLMLKIIFTSSFLLLLSNFSKGQSNYLLSLLDSISEASTKFVFIKPYDGTHIKELTIKDTSYYKNYLEEVHHFKIENEVLIELINNSKSRDTTSWTKNELKHSKLAKSDKLTTHKNYKSISRPIFTNSKEYALVAFDNSEDGFITIFKLSKSGWIKLGNIERWRY